MSQLGQMHPRLPAAVALLLIGRAALALQRNRHKPGVAMSVRIDNTSTKASLFWSPADLKEAGQHDENRITEDGAEAVMLSLGHSQRAWRVVRRMQRSEYADWLLETTLRGKRKLVALEVSGVDRGSITSRLANKLTQVAKSAGVHERWAGVAGFEAPVAALQSVSRSKHGL